MKTPLDFRITSGEIMARCPKCHDGHYMGSIDADSEDVVMQCQNCQHETRYVYRWPAELPKVTLRYKSSGQFVGIKRKSRPRRQSDVLPGQLKFGGV